MKRENIPFFNISQKSVSKKNAVNVDEVIDLTFARLTGNGTSILPIPFSSAKKISYFYKILELVYELIVRLLYRVL